MVPSGLAQHDRWMRPDFTAKFRAGNTPRLTDGHARKLADYFRVLSSGDLATWKQLFDQTWHPETVVHGRDIETLRTWHRERLIAGPTEQVHLIRQLDADRIEFTSEINGAFAVPFVDTFRDGRVYRVL